jgi:rubrerythrin
MENEKRLIDADSLKERFLIVAQSGDPVVVHVSDICAAIEDEVYEGTVDAVEVVHGRMVEVIPDHECPWHKVWECSLCGNRGEIWFNYCPNCGAKVEGGKKDGC